MFLVVPTHQFKDGISMTQISQRRWIHFTDAFCVEVESGVSELRRTISPTEKMNSRGLNHWVVWWIFMGFGVFFVQNKSSLEAGHRMGGSMRSHLQLALHENFCRSGRAIPRWGLAVSRSFGDLLLKEPQKYGCTKAGTKVNGEDRLVWSCAKKWCAEQISKDFLMEDFPAVG